MLPKKLLDSFSDYLLNDFCNTAQYEFLKDGYESDFQLDIQNGKQNNSAKIKLI
jgi:hypothetical protein